jgi:hypothetical protein
MSAGPRDSALWARSDAMLDASLVHPADNSRFLLPRLSTATSGGR